MNLLIEPSGSIRCLYSESIDLNSLGTLKITRGSHVEPNELGNWYADLSPVAGPRLGPFSFRSQALDAEVAWLDANWLA